MTTRPSERPPGGAIPPSVRVELAHAAVVELARVAGLDVLVVKGPGMDDSVRFAGRASSDIDVLVRPAHLTAFLGRLVEHDWVARDRFETGSSFEHSQTWFHPVWGDLDVHRFIAGVGLPADRAFDLLWADRTTARLAGQDIPVPSAPAQALVLCLHAARSHGDTRAERDIEHAWLGATPHRQNDIRTLVDQFDAHVAWSVLSGDLDRFRGAPTYRLWKVASQGGSRLEEWRARVEAAPTIRAKLRTAGRAVLVNTDSLSMQRGRPLTRREIATDLVRRARVAGQEGLAPARSMLRHLMERRRLGHSSTERSDGG